MIAVGAPASQELRFVGDQANPKQLCGVSRGTRPRCGFLHVAHGAVNVRFFCNNGEARAGSVFPGSHIHVSGC